MNSQLSLACVLVVETEELAARDIQATLQQLGYRVPFTATSSEQALEITRLHAPDVILMDINLRGLLDGIKTARRLKAELHTPVIFLSSSSDDTTIAQAREVGPDGFLIKPFTERALVAAIETALTRHAVEERLRSSEERLATTLECIGEAVICFDSQGIFEFCNHAAQALLGLRSENIVGRSFEALLPLFSSAAPSELPETIPVPGQPQDLHQLMRKALQGEKRWECSGTLQAFDGRMVPVEVTFSPRLGKRGTINGVVVALRDVSERAVWEDRLRHQAFHDALTGLPNRILFNDRLEHALRKRVRSNANPGNANAVTNATTESVAVLFLDLDNFKLVNDSLGHVTGDELLVQVARRLETCLRGGDTIARFGGDEFVVLVEAVDAPSYAALIASRMIELLALPFTLGGRQIHTSPSIGVAVSERGDESAEEMLRYADSAMYEAKRGGKSAFCVYREGLSETALRRLELGNELHAALEKGQLELFYQPKIALGTSQILGMEALVRWNHPRLGFIPPLEFLPIAEETNLIAALSRWVLETACLQAKIWHDSGKADLLVSVNISARQFASDAQIIAKNPSLLPNSCGLVRDVQNALEKSGLPPSILMLEITEDALIDNRQGASTLMQQLKALGVRLAIDDFGSGYSNLAYLRSFSLDFLKIERRFITGLGPDSDQVVVSSMIHLAHSLGLQIIAEGAETASEVEVLRDLGCDLVQGYFFTAPRPPDNAFEMKEKE
jgi:diguanylate cyclase (GGDEF)-like protein